MRSATRCSLLFGLLVVCTSVEAGEVPAVSGLLATPVEQLRKDELQYLQRTVADFGQLQRYRDATHSCLPQYPGRLA
ncbi:TPA: hypothetical protein MM161_005183 [Klebsiella pneumoniae]|nr:hypothetical protein [Klebsiella pneumoniae]